MVKGFVTRTSMSAAIVAFAATVVPAATISFNNDNGNGPIAASAVAGVVPAINWTTSTVGGNGVGGTTVNDLVDSTGAGSSVDINFTSQYGTWRIQPSDPGADADGTSNKRLLNGYLNTNNAVPTSYTVSDVGSTYDVYVYFSSDTVDRAGSISSGATTFYYTTAGPASIGGANATFTQATSLVQITPTANANYAVFTGLSGTQTFNNVITQGGGLTGIQVVTTAVPEPATAGVLLLGTLGLLGRRSCRA